MDTRRTESEQVQYDYYTETASTYNEFHIDDSKLSGHKLAMAVFRGILEDAQESSVLDVGSGTGRTLIYLKNTAPTLKLLGLEPVEAMREQAHKAGLSSDELLAGTGYAIPLPDNSIDYVSAFGVLHHVSQPHLVIDEMFRVARKGVFISDANNIAQGSPLARLAKLVIRCARLWKFYIWFRTRGKMYEISKGDGLYYSYSIFQNYRQIKSLTNKIYLTNTNGSGWWPLVSAPTIAIYAEIQD